MERATGTLHLGGGGARRAVKEQRSLPFAERKVRLLIFTAGIVFSFPSSPGHDHDGVLLCAPVSGHSDLI